MMMLMMIDLDNDYYFVVDVDEEVDQDDVETC